MDQPRPQLRKKASASWSKRKSSMFFPDDVSNTKDVNVLEETDDRPVSRDGKRRKSTMPELMTEPAPSPSPVLDEDEPSLDSVSEYSASPSPAPLLPELGGSDGFFSGGQIGWDERAFQQ